MGPTLGVLPNLPSSPCYLLDTVAAAGLSAEVEEVSALLQVQRPQVVLKLAPCQVLREEQQVWLIWASPGPH